MAALSIDGERVSGNDIRLQNGACDRALSAWARAPSAQRAPLPKLSAARSPSHTPPRAPLSLPAPAVTACLALANIVKSSLGPVGLDKMLVDSIGDANQYSAGLGIGMAF